MSIKTKMKPVQALAAPDVHSWDCTSRALESWADVSAAESADPSTISIYDSIGENWDGTGWTPKRMAGVLRAIGPKDITVNINSPGGNVFDGLAIYNMLLEHPAAVTVKVMGIAASAASVIAMAGDEIMMGEGSFLMIHNAWSVTIGDRNDHAAAVEVLKPVDSAMAGIYAARSGETESKMAAMMDDETYIGADDAVALGLADGVFKRDPAAPKAQGHSRGIDARRRIEANLAKAGCPRSERRRLLKDLTALHDAAAQEKTMQDAGDILSALNRLSQTISA